MVVMAAVVVEEEAKEVARERKVKEVEWMILMTMIWMMMSMV